MKHLKRFNENNQDFPTKPGFTDRREMLKKNYEGNSKVTINIPISSYELLKSKGVEDSKIVSIYTQYVEHCLGITYGRDKEELDIWIENNLDDIL